ncbi:hypothetical protein [Kitasatospora sp. CB02891]|uniref:hypothetical protein n=1 Tax=Kitasatospora sp. CB02891 TaxID=2020329 RepID=UPI000CB91EB9|nr:hypothetical protein CG736_31695 [Kitasatospora sp. CB02891]
MFMEAALLESRTLRSGLCERTEVLDEVKALVLLPDGLHVNTRMVAEYFGVGERTIRTLVRRHRQELESNGYTVLKPVDNPAGQTFKTEVWQVSGLEGGQPEDAVSVLPAHPVDSSANQSFMMKLWQVSAPERPQDHPSGGGHRPTPPVDNSRGATHRPQGGGNGVALYSRRAVLNVAMLLRDSEVARQVRSRLLDMIEGAVRPVAEPSALYSLSARPWKRWSELRWDEDEAGRRDPAVAAWRRRIDGLEPFEGRLPAPSQVAEEEPGFGFPGDDLRGAVAALAAVLGSIDRRLEAQGVVITAISERLSGQESRLDAHGARLDAHGARLDSLSEDVRAIRRDVAQLRRRRRG